MHKQTSINIQNKFYMPNWLRSLSPYYMLTWYNIFYCFPRNGGMTETLFIIIRIWTRLMTKYCACFGINWC